MNSTFGCTAEASDHIVQACTSFCRPYSVVCAAASAMVALATAASECCLGAEVALCLKPRPEPLGLPLGRAWS